MKEMSEEKVLSDSEKPLGDTVITNSVDNRIKLVQRLQQNSPVLVWHYQ